MSKNADKDFEVIMPLECELVLGCLIEHTDEFHKTDISNEDISRIEDLSDSEVDEALSWLLDNNAIEIISPNWLGYFFKVKPNALLWYKKKKNSKYCLITS